MKCPDSGAVGSTLYNIGLEYKKLRITYSAREKTPELNYLSATSEGFPRTIMLSDSIDGWVTAYYEG